MRPLPDRTPPGLARSPRGPCCCHSPAAARCRFSLCSSGVDRSAAGVAPPSAAKSQNVRGLENRRSSGSPQTLTNVEREAVGYVRTKCRPAALACYIAAWLAAASVATAPPAGSGPPFLPCVICMHGSAICLTSRGPACVGHSCSRAAATARVRATCCHTAGASAGAHLCCWPSSKDGQRSRARRVAAAAVHRKAEARGGV